MYAPGGACLVAGGKKFSEGLAGNGARDASRGGLGTDRQGEYPDHEASVLHSPRIIKAEKRGRVPFSSVRLRKKAPDPFFRRHPAISGSVHTNAGAQWAPALAELVLDSMEMLVRPVRRSVQPTFCRNLHTAGK